MKTNRWLFPIFAGTIGFLISFFMSYNVNAVLTSFVRGIISFIVFFLLFELVRFIFFYSFSDLIKENLDEADDNITADESETEKSEVAVEEDKNFNAADNSKQIASEMTEKDYNDVAQFVKTELAKSEKESSTVN